MNDALRKVLVSKFNYSKIRCNEELIDAVILELADRGVKEQADHLINDLANAKMILHGEIRNEREKNS